MRSLGVSKPMYPKSIHALWTNFLQHFFLESLTSTKLSLDIYSCPFLGFREKIRFETMFFPLFWPFNCKPVMRVSGMV